MIARRSTSLACVLICLFFRISLAGKTQDPQAADNLPTTPTAIVGRIDLNPRPDGLTIKIAISGPVLPTTKRLANPDRLVIDLPRCNLKGPNRHIPINDGPVDTLRLSLFNVQPPVTRVVVDLKEPLDFQVNPAGNEVVIDISFSKAVAAVVVSSRRAPSEKASVAPGSQVKAPPEREIVKRETPKQPGAYSLMARAKSLNVGDLQALEEKAEAGDSEAQTTLALAYHTGVLLKHDDGEALRLLQKAADHGSMAAEEALGIFAEAGIGMAQPSPADALIWYRKAVQQGSLDAATNIALMYANGKGVTRDPDQAVTWFRRAASGGDASAQYNLALMYERGEGVAQDYREAVHWLTAAANQNLVPAMLELADFSLQPPNPTVAADVGRAIRYYEKAADLGSGYAQVVLGSIFGKGLQGKVDYEQAVKWYRKAALQGVPDGQFGLAVSYALGHGVPVDYQEARRLLNAAADQGQIQAQYDFAIMCEDGKGGPMDRDLAAHYYQMAADMGMVKAQYHYGLLLAKANASRSDRIAAYKWLMLAQDSIKESSAPLGDLKKSMNGQEIAEAEQDADNWRIAHPRDAH